MTRLLPFILCLCLSAHGQALLQSGRVVAFSTVTSAPPGGSNYFGVTGTGTSSAASARYFGSGPMTPPVSGTLTAIVVYCSQETAGQVSAAIYYPTNTGRPHVLLATNVTSVTSPTTIGWVSIPMNVAVSSTTNYWLVAWGSQNTTNAYSTVTGTTNGALGDTTYATFGNPFEVNTLTSNRWYCIYGVISTP